MRNYLILITLFACVGLQARDLKSEMSAQAFTAAGLHRLSAEELKALNDYLSAGASAGSSAAVAAPASAGPSASASAVVTAPVSAVQPALAAQPLDQRGLEQVRSANDKSPIESRILGPFRGWDGNTRFELENGQVWEQIDRGESYSVRRESPQVIIIPGMMGTWFLKLSDANGRARVKRVR